MDSHTAIANGPTDAQTDAPTDPIAHNPAGVGEPVADVQSLIARAHKIMLERDKEGPQRRDVHTKMNALMRAEFTVDDSVPPELRHGIFARPGTYKAWVRSSNSSNNVQPDIERDIRGLAIKLMGVPGRKVLASDPDAPTQDFILVNARNFPARTAGETHVLFNAVLGSLWDKLGYAAQHPIRLWQLVRAMQKHANILQIRYFSPVPYALGPYVVKYVATPRVAVFDELPVAPTENFLRERAKAQLAEGEAVFDFAVQVQRDEACMPLDDPLKIWSLELSPPRKLATLRIFKQDFDTPAIDSCGENLSFNPWHSLAEHQPLGTLNMARKTIYETLSAYRHKANQSAPREPGDWDV